MKILLAGDGGQGIQTIADILSAASFNRGLHVSQVPNYGLEQRGGASLSYLQISDEEITYPKFSQPNILFIMSEQGAERTRATQKEGVNILDSKKFNAILAEKRIQPGSYNIFFLGALTKILEKESVISKEEVEKVLENKLGKKAGWTENKRAFEEGYKN